MKPLTYARRIIPGMQPIRGVALVAVLAILTTLAVLATVFAVYMQIEQRISRINTERMQADLLAKSALEHVFSLLRYDIDAAPAWDDYSEEWSRTFNMSRKQKAAGHDGWIYVTGEDGKTYGRYRVRIEDESGKININAATALDSSMQNEGIGPFELLLYGKDDRGLPIPLFFAKDILRYRYGRDLQPGHANVDDNLTRSIYAHDEIDNNANRKIDEPNEGIDEQEEYNPVNPVWDDHAFSSLNEVVKECARGDKLTRKDIDQLSRYATVSTSGRDMYWDTHNREWHRQVNLNVADSEQMLRVLRRANSEERFEPSARNLRIMGVNVIDYRDENNVLTTLGSEYGVEAICFNEIMANDGSYSLEAEGTQPGYLDKYNFVHRLGIWYDVDQSTYRYGFPVEHLSNRKGSVSCRENGQQKSFTYSADVRIGRDMIRKYNHFSYGDFQDILNDLGGWPRDLWKNAWLQIDYGERTVDQLYYPIVGNSRNYTVTIGIEDIAGYSNLNAAVEAPICAARIISGWRPGAASWCAFPEMSDFWAFPTQTDASYKPPDDAYYYVQTGEQNFGDNVPVDTRIPYFETHQPGTVSWKGYNEYMDVDGEPTKHSETRMVELRREDLKGSSMTMPQGEDKVDMLRFNYLDGEPIRARDGFIHVLLSTTRDAGYARGIGRTADKKAFNNKSCFDVVYIMRPDIIELMNISDRPISLRNWRVVINTGSYADQVALIESATHYSRAKGGLYDDPNPSIPPEGYFYLTNHRRCFDMEYGAQKDGEWGGSPDEAYCCYELPDFLWGVRYKITDVNGHRLTVEGAQWDPGQMEGEMIEIHSARIEPGRNGPTGIRKSCWESGPNWLDAQPYINWDYDGVRPGDDVLLLGMPREGGFLSMTMKNEYKQITARTVEYGSLEPGEISYSTEKFDPTHYTWVKNSDPTFGGTEERAHNNIHPRAGVIKPHVKDSFFSSVGEIQKVRKAEDWENVGAEGRGAPSTRVLEGIGRFFTVSGVRLDPEEEGVHLGGWKKAFGTVRATSTDTLLAEDARWEPNIWAGQTLRMMTGPSRGRIFAVDANSQQTLSIAGYSVPGDAQLRAQIGNEFSVGPGYASPFFYTRESNDRGVWEWKNKGLKKDSYGLYLFGLNDSIDTTEFLEENNNAELDVEVFNYKTRKYDQIPLLSQEKKARSARDIYDMNGGSQRHKYDKSDGCYCGQIFPDHISNKGGIRLRLTSHNVGGVKNSGFAWFDYAYLAPGTVVGKLNVNTATPRALTALKNVTPALARNIAYGLNNEKRRVLKPYKYTTEILKVRGMNADIYKDIGNLITTRSDQYRVVIEAETFNDVNADGVYDEQTGDESGAVSHLDVIVDRSQLVDDSPDTMAFTYTFHR